MTKKFWSSKELAEIHDYSRRIMVALYANPKTEHKDYTHNAVTAVRLGIIAHGLL